MNTLAQLTFEFMWGLQFAGEQVIDPRYSAYWLEYLPQYLNDMTAAERQALSDVARGKKAQLLDAPDTSAAVPGDDIGAHLHFLDAVISGAIFQPAR